jgi:hypothetical protein
MSLVVVGYSLSGQQPAVKISPRRAPARDARATQRRGHRDSVVTERGVFDVVLHRNEQIVPAHHHAGRFLRAV